MAVLNAFASLSNINDGVAGISITHSNANHTFTADAMGVITDATLAMFMDDIAVYVGQTKYTYTTGTAATGEFSIGTITAVPSGHGLNFATPTVVNTNEARITVTDGSSTTGFADALTINGVVINVPISINIAGTVTVANQGITLSKAAGGSAPLVRVVANTQTVKYNVDNTIARTANIVFTSTSQNIESGAWTWQYGKDGAVPSTTITGSNATIAGAGSTSDSSTVTFTPAQWNTILGNNDEVTVRATRDDSFDQESVDKLDAGTAFSLQIIITAGNPQFINGAGSVSMRADFFTNGIESTTAQYDDYEFTWSLDGVTNGTAEQLGSAGGRTRTFSASDVTGDADMTKLVRVQINTDP